ncbi:MAG: HAD hydrolase family protein [Candidatus Omnitrophota bacterium]
MAKRTKLTPSLKKKAKNIELLIMDVDGVLTPGYIVLDESGAEMKFFDVHDGFGLALWKKAGLKTAIITAGNTKAVMKRAEYLKVDKVCQNASNKLKTYNILKEEFALGDEQICFIGDDLIDLPVLKKAGFSCCVSNAHKDALPFAHYVSRNKGGRGAVREIIDIILKAKGLWDKVTSDYFNGSLDEVSF